MSEIFQSILVAADQYRGDACSYRNVISLAEKLHASVRMCYTVDFEDLKILAPGPLGEMTRHLFRGTLGEAVLVAKGRDKRKAFSALCERASIEHSGEVLVGPSDALWAEEARSCDLVTILPVEEDFERFREQWFGRVFWRIAVHSCRPVLIFGRDGLPLNGMVLFYSNRIESARALPWVAALCSALETSLTVYTRKSPSRRYARDKEWQAFFDHHRRSARFEDKNALEVLSGELKQSGSELGKESLVVFDGGFHRGLWFQKHRRLVERLIHRSDHSILLCP